MGEINPYLAARLNQITTPITLLIEVEPNRADDVKRSLSQLGFTISAQSFNFLTVPNVLAAKVEVIQQIAGVVAVHFDKRVKALSLPSFLGGGGLDGEFGIDEVVAPRELLGPDLLIPFSPLRMLRMSNYTFIPNSVTKKLVVDKETDLDGSGVKVAVLDTGMISWTSPFNQFRFKPFSTSLEGFPGDGIGHGGWCETMIAGLPFPTLYGKVEGMAPRAELYSIKVLSTLGVGSTTEVLAGMELASKLGVKIVSMSLGSEASQGGCESDPICKAAKILSEQGILVIVAGGNSGPNSKTIGSPGISPHVVTVGSVSVTDRDDVSSFSSRGPTEDGLTKPDVCSYGGGNKSADAIPSELIVSGCEGWLDPLYDGLIKGFAGLRGTSMAAPTFAGLMALVEQDRNRKGSSLRLSEVMSILAEKGSKEKSNDDGFGVARLSWFVD